MTDALTYLTPEARARVRIDEMLVAAGWAVQDARAVNLGASRGVAVREFISEAARTGAWTTSSTSTARPSA